MTALDCPPLVAPLHLLAGLLGLRVPLRVKLEAVRLGLAVRLGRRPEGLTLAQYLERCGQSAAARRLLWDPLALAILNESPERAAAVLFHRVYREAFLRDRARLAARVPAPRLGRPRRPPGALLRGARRRRAARACARSVSCSRAGASRASASSARAHGREAIAAGAAVRALDARGGRGREQRATAGRAARCSREEWGARRRSPRSTRFSGSPILSIEVWLDRVVVDRVMLGLRDCDLEWLFDKGRLHGRTGAPQHLAFIVSAAFRSAAKSNARARWPRPRRRCAATSRRWRRRGSPARSCSASRWRRSRRRPELEALRPGRSRRSRASTWRGTGPRPACRPRSRAPCAAASVRPRR